MKILDRYILKQFLGTFLFTVMIIVSVIIVIHYADNADDFAKAQLSTRQVLSYYLNYIPWLANFISPLTVFIATVFVTSQLAGRTEVIAILGSGVSFRRLLVPYFYGALFLAIVSFILTGWVIPESNKDRVAFEVKYLKSSYHFDQANYHTQLARNVYFYLKSYDNKSQTGTYFTLEKVKGTRLEEKLTANTMSWNKEKGLWSLKGWKWHRLEGDREQVQTGVVMDTALAIEPSEFENDYKRYDALTIPELSRYIDKLHLRGATNVKTYEVEKYVRFTSPFAVIILAFLGVVISARKTRGGTGLQVAVGFFLAFLYIVIFILTKTIVEATSLDPALSVCIPNALFFSISVVLYRYLPK